MKFIALIVMGIILGGMPFFTHLHKTATGVIVPMYSYPNDSWNALIYEKVHNESVPIIVIINPDNGPGIKNSDYIIGIQKLQHARITVLGYVSTGYGSRDPLSVVSDINNYKNWYHVNGIFFDEMSYRPGFETYYANLTKYAKSLGMVMTVGNPGVDTIPSYIGTVDNIVIHENSSIPSTDLFGGWHTNYTKSNFSIILYNASSINSTYVKFLSEHAGYVYITNQSDPNPWEKLSPYFDGLVSILKVSSQYDIQKWRD